VGDVAILLAEPLEGRVHVAPRLVHASIFQRLDVGVVVDDQDIEPELPSQILGVGDYSSAFRDQTGKAAIRTYLEPALAPLKILLRRIDHVPDRIIGDAGHTDLLAEGAFWTDTVLGIMAAAFARTLLLHMLNCLGRHAWERVPWGGHVIVL
jgi:hypothetical protein